MFLLTQNQYSIFYIFKIFYGINPKKGVAIKLDCNNSKNAKKMTGRNNKKQ